MLCALFEVNVVLHILPFNVFRCVTENAAQSASSSTVTLVSTPHDRMDETLGTCLCTQHDVVVHADRQITAIEDTTVFCMVLVKLFLHECVVFSKIRAFFKMR